MQKGVADQKVRFECRYWLKAQSYDLDYGVGKVVRIFEIEPESMEKIKNIVSELKAGKKETFYYEVERNGRKLGVTVAPFDIDVKEIGFIQCFSVIK